MRPGRVEHYVEQGFESRAEFLPDEDYNKLLRNVVRTAADVLVMDKRGKVLLGKRIIKPLPGWFTFGGRIIPGESPEQACARTVRVDISLDASLDRFVFLAVASFVLAPPPGHGRHDVVLFHLLVINDQEIPLIKLSEEGRQEHGEIKWFDLEEILSDRSMFHQATLMVVKKAMDM